MHGLWSGASIDCRGRHELHALPSVRMNRIHSFAFPPTCSHAPLHPPLHSLPAHNTIHPLKRLPANPTVRPTDRPTDRPTAHPYIHKWLLLAAGRGSRPGPGRLRNLT